jgi:hypothetical protein
MTRRKFRISFILVGLIYLLAIAGGWYFYICNEQTHYYEVYKELTTLIMAIPAAYLAYCYQQRSSFLAELRQSWRSLVKSVAMAIQYTHLQSPTQKEYGETLSQISQSMDEIRCLYKNIDEEENERGLLPFEKIKTIFKTISDLKCGNNFNFQEAREARSKIVSDWKDLRKVFLKEFDRTEPTYYHTILATNDGQ